MSDTRYPEIEVQLTGQNGNALNLIGIVRKALRRANVPDEEVLQFTEQATMGDYDNVLVTCMEWVTVL